MRSPSSLAKACVLLTLGLLVFCIRPGHAAAATPSDTSSVIQEAFVYAFPVYEVARVRHLATKAKGDGESALNRLVHLRSLSDHTDRWVTTPNNDTLYSNAFLDLTRSPVELSTPDFGDRYFSIAFMDVFTNNFSVIGRRTTGTRPQRYLIAGPDWRGEAPAGATLIHAPGNWVWLLVRTLITGRDDLQAVHRLQDSITLKAPADPGYPASVDPGSDSAENFIAVVNQALAHNPPPLADKPVLERIAKVGIAPGAGLPDARILEAWRAGFAKLKPGLNAAAQARQTIAAAAGWSPSPPDLGDFGTNYGLRALVAHVGLAALPPAEVVYSKAVSDNTGSPLQADQHYRWHIPAAGLPVNAFWSLSAYEVSADGAHFFADNAIHRYSIGDRTDGLVRNADGSLDILIQHEAPQGALAANWLPLPAGPVRLFLRAYQPRPELAQGKYHFPVLERLP